MVRSDSIGRKPPPAWLAGSDPSEASVPQSRHRRKGRSRPRPSKAAGPPVKPPPSPPWVPIVGIGTIVLGIAVILAYYIIPALSGNVGLIVGFILIAIGFVFLTRWR